MGSPRMTMDRKTHWENVYNTKDTKKVSWYQPAPEVSLSLIRPLELDSEAAIVDVGGGDSLLADNLLELGYSDITVLDISETALKGAATRLGRNAKAIKWIVADASQWQPKRKYDLWHDRAAFHFLTLPEDIGSYVKAASEYIKPGGYLILGTFASDGPEKCSGLPVQRYGEEALRKVWEGAFEGVECMVHNHVTPSGSQQSFLFYLFRHKI